MELNNLLKYHFAIPCFLTVAACMPEEMDLETPRSEISRIVVTPEKINIVEGHSATLSAQITPWNAEERTVIWSSSDGSVVSVGQDGRITANIPGEAEVIASIGDVIGRSYITVRSSHIPAESVKIRDISSLSIKVGETSVISAEVFPEDATELAEWSSSDPDIFTVDPETGKLTALSAGMATLTASVSGGTSSIPVLVHGDFWIEPTDALEKPVASGSIGFVSDTIRVARGEVASFQGIIYSDVAQGMLTPSVTRFAPEGQDGIAVAPEIYWVRDVRCSRHWDAWAGGAPADELWSEGDMYPDPLMPADKWDVSISAGEKKAIWVEFPIPHDIAPGVYAGEMQVSGSSTATCRFHVEIYDVDLPEKQGLNVVNWIHTSLDAMNGGVAPDREQIYSLIANSIVPFMNRYGQNCYRLNYTGSPFSDFTVEYNPETARYEPDFRFSNFEYEFNMYLKACPDLCQLHGTNIIAGSDRGRGTLTLLGIELDDNGKPVVNQDGNFNIGYYEVKGKVPEVEAFFVPYFRQLQQFLDSHELPDGRTWTDLYVQTIFDEPTDVMAEAWNTVAGYVKQESPDIRILEPVETARLDPELLDYPCPTLGKIADNRAVGNQVQWMYTCMQPQGNFANRFIRIPLIKTRIIHWVNYLYNASGYLHWGLNYWIGAENRPYEDATGAYLGGDMYIIYPGDHEVYPSIRLCAMRDGINDYDLLRMVEAESPAKAKEFCNRLVQDNANYNTDVKAFRQLRKDMLEYLAE